jgi:branched-chain amino acid transport system substrate-binding protein
LRKLAVSILFLILIPQASFSQNVRVGVSVPLSGNGAEYGSAAKNGFLLAREIKPELNRFDFIYDDNEYQSVKSLNSFRKLKNIDRVDLLYVWGEPGFNSISPVAEAENFPFFCMSLDRSPGVGKKFAIRVSGDTYQLSEKLVGFLEQKKAESVDVILAEDPFFEASLTALKERLNPKVKLTNAVTLPMDNTDFRSLILKLKNSKTKFLGVFLMAGQVRNFFRQAAQMGLNSQFIGTDVFESSEEIRESGTLINGSVYANFFVPESFYKSYTAKFGNDTQISHAYMAYAFASSLPLIVPSDHKIDAEAILENLKKLDWEATGRMFSYKDSPSEGKHFEFPVVLREIQNGKAIDIVGPQE